jgi:hypothetical protein
MFYQQITYTIRLYFFKSTRKHISELKDLCLEYQRLQKAYLRMLPKVDPNIIDDFFDANRKHIHTHIMSEST